MLAEAQTQALQATARSQIERLEAEMRSLPQLAIATQHTFGPGFYARTIEIPAGATLTGKVHATEHIFILSRGSMLLVTDDARAEVHAPYQAVCRPGLKRAGLALSDCECTNVHITTETDLDKLEAQLIEPPAPIEHDAALPLGA